MTKISVLAPDLSGGGGTRVYLIAQVLQKLNYDVTVFGFLFGERLYPPPPPNLQVVWVKGCFYPELLNSIRQLLKQIDGDILYAIKPKPTSFGIALLKRLLTRKEHYPLILDIDDWEISWFEGGNWKYRPSPKQFLKDILNKDGYLRNPNFWLYIQWIEKLVNQADVLTVNNQFLQNLYGGVYLPNGKDTDLFDPQRFDYHTSRQKYGLEGYRVLIFPGSARPHKGLEDVLQALTIINQPDLRLVIVGGKEIGDGYVEKLLSEWSQWLIKLPQLPSENVAEIVAGADIFVVPQRQDPTALAQFPMKLTDGMAMAKPILSTHVGDIPEILGDTGYLVTPNSPEEIAAQIEWIFDHLEEAKAKGIQARQRCIENYSLDSMGEILAQVVNYVNY